MTHGRELDCAIAEKVMGLPNVSWDHAIIKPCYSYHDKAFMSIPNYSTDIADAWAVLLKLGDNYGLQVRGGEWIVFTGYHDFIAAEADTAPHAICMAALKSIGVEF